METARELAQLAPDRLAVTVVAARKPESINGLAFHRSFTLPNTVDASKVSADYKNGVLTVKLPFREEAKPRTINVEVAA